MRIATVHEMQAPLSGSSTRRRRWWALLAMFPALILVACQTSQVVMNEKLPQPAGNATPYGGGYRMLDMIRPHQGEILMALAFSGGGKRSAAFAHGALRGLRDIPVMENGKTRRLLDEVDYIASVSGGSFPAMHYGLYRDKSFETFPKDFLYRDIESYIYGIYLLPWNWEWLINPLYGTNDAMAAIYDKLMFHGATYADLLKQGLPVISINATDIANGVSFPFTQPTFDLLCSDLTKFPVARAVAASNGFPVLFSPITLNSYRPDCHGQRPPDAPPANWATDTGLSRRAEAAQIANRYLDPDRTKYVHLMDGGIADNLALRALLNAFIGLDQDNEAVHRLALTTRRVLIISVDGEAAADPTLGRQRIVTGLSQVFSAVSGSQIDAYNFETLVLAQDQVQAMVARLKRDRCAQAPIIDGHACDDVTGNLVHLSLSDVSDPVARARLQAIPTGLTIPKQDVDTLVAYGEKLIRDNATIQATVSGLDEVTSPAADHVASR